MLKSLGRFSLFKRCASNEVDLSKIKRLVPRTPGTRHAVLIDRSELWKGRPIRELTKGLRKTGGRNNSGKVTVRHIGGGHKKLYRFIDFKRSVHDTPGVVQRLEYDPNRSSHIALVAYPDGALSYIIAPQNLNPGDIVTASRSKEVEIKPGNAMPIGNMPAGTVFSQLELYPGRGAQLARGAGTYCELLDKNPEKQGYALVRLNSKEVRLVLLNCMGTIGAVSNPLHKLRKLGKAGRSRWMGIRPTVRGVAMNPFDHPHGGGEDKGKPGRPSISYSGVLAKGFKTRKAKPNPLIVVGRDGRKKKSKSAK